MYLFIYVYNSLIHSLTISFNQLPTLTIVECLFSEMYKLLYVRYIRLFLQQLNQCYVFINVVDLSYIIM